MIKKALKHYPLLIIVFLWILFTLFTYKDYGITADEELEYNLGKNMMNYFIDKRTYENNELLMNKPYLKYYYHLYPMVLTILNVNNYYEWYHLMNMLFTLFIIIVSYVVFYIEYKNKYLATVIPVLILITPQFLGHIPANTKDTPFAIMYFISILSLYILNKNSIKINKIYKILILGILFGFTQSLRIIGYSLYILYIINILDSFIDKYKIHIKNINTKLNTKELQTLIKNIVIEMLGIIFVAHLLMWLTYPYIRENIINVFNLFSLSKNFTPWDRTIIYMGEILNRNQRPWHYLFIYIGITTPLFLLITHILSIRYLSKDKLLRLLVITILLNYLAYLIMNPIIYNGLRHFLYILPLIASTSGIYIIHTIKFSPKTAYLYAIFILMIVFQIFIIHPYQYIYFNSITKYFIKTENMFETDYWGTSYREATKYLLKHLKQNKIVMPKVYSCNVDYAVRYYSEYKFDIVNTRSKADFIICDYQYDKQMDNTKYPIIKVIERNGMILNIIRETKNNTLTIK
jgi:hypothetical protein